MINIYKIALFLLSLVLLNNCMAQTRLETGLYNDISDFRLDHFSKIQAAFILSGATTSDSLDYYLDWYNDLLQTLNNYHFDPFDKVTSADKIFNYLHSSWLITYKEEATTLINVVNTKQYNCVAGTILFNLVCEDMGFTTEAFETPTHTYTIFTDFDKQIMVENTSGMGFNIMQNLREYSQYLLQFYPNNQGYQIGLDRIYAYENSKGRKIDNTELLGLLAYNRAYFAMKDQNFKSAYEYVSLAQKFNKDSRSNINFEIDLYHKWGKQLFDNRDYETAFTVFANAWYRYWDLSEFTLNCKAAFFNAMSVNWVNKDWDSVKRIVPIMLELNILEEKEQTRLGKMLGNWSQSFYNNGSKKSCLELVGLWGQVTPDDPQLQSFRQAVKSMN